MCEEQDAEALVSQGVAEMYEAKANDIIVEDVTSGDSGGITEDVVKSIIEQTVKASSEEMLKQQRLGGHSEDKADYEKTAGFDNFAAFAHSVFKAGPKLENINDKLSKWQQHVKATGLSEGINADGGFLVPTEFRATLLRNALERTIVRQRATVIPMNTNSVTIPVVNESTHSGSLFGGVVIYRPDEGGTKTSSKPEFGQVQLNLHKLVGLVYATDELLEDSPISLQPLLTEMFTSAIAWQEDEDFINGTGAGQALGVMNSPCLVSVAKETGQAATTIVTENIVKMWSRLYPQSQGNAVWIANNDTFPQLATLSLSVGTGGSAVGILNINGTGIAGAANMKLLGKPLLLTEHCQTLGTTGDIILCDWRQYLIGQKVGQQIKMDTSIHVNFVYDETAFRFVMRYDGQPWWPSTLTPVHSTNTLSPFVALAARA
jgi:HK97 family phage major capsid protein